MGIPVANANEIPTFQFYYSVFALGWVFLGRPFLTGASSAAISSFTSSSVSSLGTGIGFPESFKNGVNF